MKITRINHAAVNIHGKVDEARAFYTGLLGLPEVPIQLPGRPPIPPGTVQAFWLELGGVQVHAIGAPLKHEPREPQGPHFQWDSGSMWKHQRATIASAVAWARRGIHRRPGPAADLSSVPSLRGRTLRGRAIAGRNRGRTAWCDPRDRAPNQGYFHLPGRASGRQVPSAWPASAPISRLTRTGSSDGNEIDPRAIRIDQFPRPGFSTRTAREGDPAGLLQVYRPRRSRHPGSPAAMLSIGAALKSPKRTETPCVAGSNAAVAAPAS